VLDRHGARNCSNAVDHLAAEPAGALLGVRRDDHLVRLRVEHRHRVPDGVLRIGVDDEAVRLDPGLVQRGQRAVEPAPGGRAPRVFVDDVARMRLADRRDDGDEVRTAGSPLLQRLDQALAGHRLVRDHQDVMCHDGDPSRLLRTTCRTDRVGATAKLDAERVNAPASQTHDPP
jgi:hypothetical protein